jgi:hypothetical protein
MCTHLMASRASGQPRWRLGLREQCQIDFVDLLKLTIMQLALYQRRDDLDDVDFCRPELDSKGRGERVKSGLDSTIIRNLIHRMHSDNLNRRMGKIFSPREQEPGPIRC